MTGATEMMGAGRPDSTDAPDGEERDYLQKALFWGGPKYAQNGKNREANNEFPRKVAFSVTDCDLRLLTYRRTFSVYKNAPTDGGQPVPKPGLMKRLRCCG
jgi:hypothetical protein